LGMLTKRLFIHFPFNLIWVIIYTCLNQTIWHHIIIRCVVGIEAKTAHSITLIVVKIEATTLIIVEVETRTVVASK